MVDSNLSWDSGYGWTYKYYFQSLEKFRDSAYAVLPLCEHEGFSGKKVLFLRHDVDFNIEAAFNLAQAEHAQGIRSSYYFRVNSAGYNLLSIQNLRKVLRIAEYGHEVSVHVDHGLSSDPDKDLMLSHSQISAFETFTGLKVVGFSSHEPARLGTIDPATRLRESLGLKYHAYDRKFTAECKYISDSTKRWREKPFSEFVDEVDRLQVLIHPVWWYENLPQESY